MDKPFTVFLSGPGASHNPDYRKSFRKAENALRHRGFAAVNLACAFPAHWDHTVVMPHCLDAVARCDAILMLDGWQDSIGARQEYDAATAAGIPAFVNIEALTCWLTHNGGGVP